MSYTLNYTGSEIDDILDRAAPGGAIDQALATKQDALTFDAVPTEGSTNPAESGGIYDAIQAGGAAALAAFATDSVSGDVVSFPDGADGIPVKAFTGSILPQQNLNGQSAPYPAGGGKNLLPSWENGGTIGSVPIVKQANGCISINGAVAGFRVHSDAVTLAAGTYTFSVLKVSGSVTANIQIDIRKSDGSAYPATLYVSSSTANGSQQKATFTLSASGDYQFSIYASTTLTDLVLGLMVESGSTATAYAPYANICPISGWTGANITRAGRNLFNPHPNHNVSAQGEYIESGAAYWATDYIPIGDTKSVVVSVADLGGMTDGSIVRVEYASNGAVTSTIIGYFNSYSTPWTFTLADNIVGLRFRGYRSGGASPITGAKIQAEFGSSATAYQPYNGSTILLDFGQTVYAGTLTALGGGLWKIQPTMGVLNLASKTFVRQSGSSIASPYFDTPMTGLNVADRASAVCNMYRYSTPNAGDAEESVFGFTSNGTYLRIRDNRYSTAADFMANAIPSCVILYPLATLPDPITITGEDLQTLLGANTVWTDVGSVNSLEYRADTALYIQKLIGGGGTLQTLSMASPSPSLSLGRVGVLAEPEADAEPEEVTEEPEADTEEATEE